jgi:DNA-binding NarL/FixJ family response regulator
MRGVVVDRSATFRGGLSQVLEQAGFAISDVDDLRSWAAGPGQRFVILTIRHGPDWKELAALREVNGDLLLVALLVSPTPDDYATALRSGATSAAAWEASPNDIVVVLTAAAEGMVLLPYQVAHAMAAKVPAAQDSGWITHEELEWLRVLATGATIQELAEQVAYSERSLYRLLHDLYQRMGVSNRTEAVLEAARRGLLN